jgi:G3E family GTPase
MDTRIPVTILTGDSGVGKTTLLNRILSGDRGRRYAVITNVGNAVGEVAGEVVIDTTLIGDNANLIVRTEEELFEMNSGCICCTIRGDLIRAIHRLLEDQAGNFDAIIIETTANADPGPIVQTFFVDYILEERARLDSVIALVDAQQVSQRMGGRPMMQQIGFADQIVLNKTSLPDLKNTDAAAANAAVLAAIELPLRRINPLATFHRVQHVDALAIDQLLERGAFDMARGAALPADFAALEHSEDEDGEQPGAGDVIAISLHTEAPMNFERIDDWLARLVTLQGADILRGKGVIDVIDADGEHGRLAFQSVQMLHEGNLQQRWAEGEQRRSHVVFIGRNLDRVALQTGFMSCAAAGVSSSALASAA